MSGRRDAEPHSRFRMRFAPRLVRDLEAAWITVPGGLQTAIDPAIGKHRLPSHVRCPFGSEPNNQIRDLLRLAQPAHRGLRGPGFVDLLVRDTCGECTDPGQLL